MSTQRLQELIAELDKIRDKSLGLFWQEFPVLIAEIRNEINGLDMFDDIVKEINEAEARHVCACYRIIAKTSGELNRIANNSIGEE